MASLSKNRDIEDSHVDIAEDLSTPGTPISAHQSLVTPTAAPLRENLHTVLESLRSKIYEEILSWRTVFFGGGDEEWRDGCKICKGWRGGLDPSCEKEEEEF